MVFFARQLEAALAALLGLPLMCTFFVVGVLGGFVRNPRLFLQGKKKSDTVPPILLDPKWGDSLFVQANGLKFHYVAKGQGPLMLCLHGFPEVGQFWFSWRAQLQAFSDDYRVVAVDMRGYYESDRPQNPTDYDLCHLLCDVEAIIQGLGYEKCVLMGHDWGAMVAWEFGHYRPDMLDRLIVLSIPHPNTLRFRDYFMLSHVPFINIPILPELLLSAGDYYLMRTIYGAMGTPFNRPLSSEEVDAYMYAITRPGALTATLNWYRNTYTGHVTPAMKAGHLAHAKIPVPTLLLQGQDDNLFRRAAFHDSIQKCNDLTVVFIPNADHWILQEQPDAINTHVADFLKKSL